MSARAQTEIALDIPYPTKDAVQKILPSFEAKTGYTVKTHIGVGLGTKQDAAHGEPYDVFVILPPFDEALASGNLVKNTGTVIGSFVLAVTVKKGSPLPDLSTTDSVRKALLSATPLVTTGPTTDSGGLASDTLLKKLGIIEQLQSTIKYVANGPSIGQAVLAGEGAIGLGPYFSDTTFQPQPPLLVIVGALPRSVATPTDIYAFVSTHAKDPAAAKALIKYLTTPQAQKIYKEGGILPHK